MASFVFNSDEQDAGTLSQGLTPPPNLLKRTFWYAQRRYWKQGLAAVAIYTAVMVIWSLAVR